ncbi:MAG: NB-ARC domain-containing protein [Chloroflexota bacterium]
MSLSNSITQFADLLEDFRARADLSFGRLAKLSDMPRATIVSWENGASKRPQQWQGIVKVASALELSKEEASQLLRAAHHLSIDELYSLQLIGEDQALLKRWVSLGTPLPDEVSSDSASPSQHYISHQEEVSPQTIDAPVIPDVNPVTHIPRLPRTYVRRKRLEADAIRLLQNHHSLVLWGQGGSGKTTLAMSLAAQLAYRFRDGVIWWQLRPEDTVDTAIDWIATHLDLSLREGPLPSRVMELNARLQHKNCLIILDDLWGMSALHELRIDSLRNWLLITTRDQHIAHQLEAKILPVQNLDSEEGITLLDQWIDYVFEETDSSREEIEAKSRELVTRLGGLPLALRLCGAQLDMGATLDELLEVVRDVRLDLDLLDLGQMTDYSLSLSYHFSVKQLTHEVQRCFMALGYFARKHFEQNDLAPIWGMSPRKTRKVLLHLTRFALLTRIGNTYHIHDVIHAYANQILKNVADDVSHTYARRHAALHIRHILYHPGLIDPNETNAPNLEQKWSDVVRAVRWAMEYEPEMAVQAMVLAHTERLALLESVGPTLLDVTKLYMNECPDVAEQAMIAECLGDLYLFESDYEHAIQCFSLAGKRWQSLDEPLAVARTYLRIAGVHLLCEKLLLAVESAREALVQLETTVPIEEQQLWQGRWLFYWFNVVYSSLNHWHEFDEEYLICLSTLGKRSGQSLLEARAVKIHRDWATTSAIERSSKIRDKGCKLALHAYKLWKLNDQDGLADDEISFTIYSLKKRYSQKTATRFAKRCSALTPEIDSIQSVTVKSKAIRWWLNATEKQRIGWLSYMLPRYLASENRPRHKRTKKRLARLLPNSVGYRYVNDILGIGGLGKGSRRIVNRPQFPTGHFLNHTYWQALHGQRPHFFLETQTQKSVQIYLKQLDSMLI